MGCNGEPIKGHVHSSDASSGVTATLYDQANNARTLGDDEYLELYQLSVITGAGGDVRVFVGDDTTPADAETLARGTYAANGGEEKSLYPPFVGNAGQNVHVTAPAGALDLTFSGTIRRVDTGKRPSWRESDFGQ